MVKFELPKLPYSYDALEPYISEDTLKVHHGKHHQAYTDKFNAALEAENIEEENIFNIFSNVSKYSAAVRNQGGGYWNHMFYWESLRAANENNKPTGKVLKMIEESFDSFENFQEVFSNKAASLFGSGWTWLGVEDGKLIIFNTANQDNSYMDVCDVNAKPLLVIDVWEHAYYLDYQNRRPEHIEKFFKIINWEKVEERLNNN